MLAIHPPLSGMPLAFIMLLVVVELIRLRGWMRDRLIVTRDVVVYAVVVSTVCSFLSGYQASSNLGDLAQEVSDALGRHHALGRLLLINAILMLVFHVVSKVAIHGKRLMQWLYFVTVVIQLLLSCWVGYLGGSLVFDRGLGVVSQAIKP